MKALAFAATSALAIVLSGCTKSSDSEGKTGTIAFEEGAAQTVKLGSFREVVLSLQASSGVIGQKVLIVSDDTGIADVTPAACTLSSSSGPSSKCTVKIHGKSKGQAMLTARAEGYPPAPLAATIGDAVVYGNLSVMDDSGAFVTLTPVPVSFHATGAPPFTRTLTARISGSSGLTGATDAYINFGSTAANVSFNPPQCQVTSASAQCSTTVSLPTAAPASILVQVVGAVTTQNPGYRSITLNASASTIPAYGDIVLSTQSGNHVPNGMKAPLFVNWTNASANDRVTITLNIAGTGVSFYSFAPGNNHSFATSNTQTCTLQYTGVPETSTLSCGFGLVGAANSGTVTISATPTSASNHQYTIAPLTLGAVAPEPTRRSITFVNNSTKAVYVGITGGAASSFVSPTTSSTPPGTTTGSLKPGAGSVCGPSNPKAACPIGTTCIQGGSAPSASISDTPFYCYYDQKDPTAGYQVASGGGSTVFEISSSSLSPNGIIWSGNFYGRTGCDATTGVCENATCVGATAGLACGPGTGAAPGINTLAEATFQSYPATDFYDVSIINGANFAVQFGPTGVPVSSTNAYSCGVAGNPTAQNGGYARGATSTAGLPAASWTMSPTAASFPPGVTLTGDPSSYFRLVIPSNGLPGTSCTSSSTCTTAPDTTCGYAMANLVRGNFNFATRTCGRAVAYLTADSIWGFNQSATNAAPFAFTTSWPNGLGGTVSVGDLQLCINRTYSPYENNGSSSTFPTQPIALACGGVMWGATESPGPTQNPAGNFGLDLTPPAEPVRTANANWLANVLPTIRWLKQACPTCYTYAFDDMTSTFTCADTSRSPNPRTNYNVIFSDLLSEPR